MRLAGGPLQASVNNFSTAIRLYSVLISIALNYLPKSSQLRQWALDREAPSSYVLEDRCGGAVVRL
jgi:hypothetical protein